MKPLQLTDWTHTPERFFRELPDDWAEGLRNAWPDIAGESRLLVNAENRRFTCGGIVSRAIFPDMGPYEDRARELYNRQYWYIGYLFVHPKHRSEGLGTRWMEAVQTEVPARGFWLVIEKIGLLKFYARSGFHVDRILHIGEDREWLLIVGREEW